MIKHLLFLVLRFGILLGILASWNHSISGLIFFVGFFLFIFANELLTTFWENPTYYLNHRMTKIASPLVAFFIVTLMLPQYTSVPFIRVIVPIAPESNVFEPLGVSDLDYQFILLIEELGINDDVFYARTDDSIYFSDYVGVYQQGEFSQEQSELIDAWRLTKTPDHLRDARIQYLLYDANWERWLTEEEYNILQSPENYTLIYEGVDNEDLSFFLWEVNE